MNTYISCMVLYKIFSNLLLSVPLLSRSMAHRHSKAGHISFTYLQEICCYRSKLIKRPEIFEDMVQMMLKVLSHRILRLKTFSAVHLPALNQVGFKFF